MHETTTFLPVTLPNIQRFKKKLFTGRLSNKPFLIWLLTTPRHVKYGVKGSPYSITERRVPELIPVLGSQPAGDMSHKPDGRLPLLPARSAVTENDLRSTAS